MPRNSTGGATRAAAAWRTGRALLARSREPSGCGWETGSRSLAKLNARIDGVRRWADACPRQIEVARWLEQDGSLDALEMTAGEVRCLNPIVSVQQRARRCAESSSRRGDAATGAPGIPGTMPVLFPVAQLPLHRRLPALPRRSKSIRSRRSCLECRMILHSDGMHETVR